MWRREMNQREKVLRGYCRKKGRMKNRDAEEEELDEAVSKKSAGETKESAENDAGGSCE